VRCGVPSSRISRSQNRATWLSPQGQYLAAALVLFFVLFGGNLPTPLYPAWQQQFGLSTGTITAVYAVYPAGVVLGLLFGGRLADQLGRRPIVALAALASVLAEACFIMAGSVGLLFAGRLINGCAIGLLTGPAVAAIAELNPQGDRKKGAWLGALTTVTAIAFGPLLAALLVGFPPVPAMRSSFPFVVHMVALAAALILVGTCLRETAPASNLRSWRDVSVVPQGITVPLEIRNRFWLAAAVAFLVWACTGLWLALGPSLVMKAVGSSDRLVGGLAVVAVLGTAGAVQILGRMMDARNSMIIGLLLLPPGLLLIIATLLLQSRASLVFGCVITGGAQGFGWMGSSESIGRLAPPEQRASVMSAFYIVAYAGVALPVLAVGMGADWVGLPTAVSTLAVAVTVTALSLVTRLLRPHRVSTISGA
jgi:MFS family permease